MSLDQEVDIDASGTYKYVLIKLHFGDGSFKVLVRGYSWGEYHDDIYQKTLQLALSAGLDTECLGGGRISHDPDKREILVYGYSVGYGRADHSEAVRLIKKKYPSYKVDWANEGY